MKQHISDWRLTNTETGESIPAQVPGDITADLFRAGRIPDPFYADNHKQLGWIARTDFTYTAEFVPDTALMALPEVYLTLDGADLFAEVLLNGNVLGRTENMFLPYRYEVRNMLCPDVNRVEVRFHSTVVRAEDMDTSKYFGVFDTKRILLRKAQCQFGWDWAFDLPGYGLWQPVYLEGLERHRIENVRVSAGTDGWATFRIRLNYLVRSSGFDPQGNPFSFVLEEGLNDRLRVSLERKPGGGWKDALTYETGVAGRKNLVNLHVDEPELWWPAGYGTQPLYAYRVELLRAGRVLSAFDGHLAFRTVAVCERPTGNESMSFGLTVNGIGIRVRGSNWVPMESFTGTMRGDKYRRLLNMAAEANVNMLRVWGGGVYENELFYDLCDRMGILVWQDFMTACADIPEDDASWIRNMTAECTHQVKRLRNHPCIALWCGGNEKTGAYGQAITQGDTFVNETLRGLVTHYDDTRPYIAQSPHAWTDIGNDCTSGDSHCSSFETVLTEGAAQYARLVAGKTAAFVSECAIMGPADASLYKQVFPETELWPINDLWRDRLMDNPYAAVKMPFADRQAKLAAELYGPSATLDAFIAKGMLLHAEALALECGHCRVNAQCGGFLNWMFSDDWPTASWAVVDYYGTPKQAYYEMRRAYAPQVFVCDMTTDGRIDCYAVNDSRFSANVSAVIAVKTYDGTEIYRRSVTVVVPSDGRIVLDSVSMPGRDAYVSVAGTVDGQPVRTLYSPHLWSSMPLTGDCSVSVRVYGNEAEVTVTADAGLVKAVHIDVKNGVVSDDYFDLEAGEQRTIAVKSTKRLTEEDIVVTHFAARIRENAV